LPRSLQLPTQREIKAVRLWLHKPDANNMIVRCVDAQGETFQKDLRYHYPGWQEVEFSLTNWVFNWNGDGVFDKPAKQVDILIQPDGGRRVGELLIDDVRWVYEETGMTEWCQTLDPLPRIRFRQRRLVDPGHHWLAARSPTTSGPTASPTTGRRAACTTVSSILGEPQTLRLTVESDGSGHELTATCGSHFQYFHATAGHAR
jgi:hypothetical protein